MGLKICMGTEADRWYRVFRPAQMGLLAGLVVLMALYYTWTWSTVLGDFGGDNALYLMTAKQLSPWSGQSEVSAYFAVRSQYPPLYPVVLALFGGGESLVMAHLITTSCLLTAFVLLFVWVRSLGFSRLFAAGLVALFAMLPGTYIQALSILSENLYLALTLAVLAMASRAEDFPGERWDWWVTAIFVAAATLTRSAGISLVAGFCLYLAVGRPIRRWYLLCVVSVFPMLLWAAAGFGHGVGYVADFTAKYHDNFFATLSAHVVEQAQVIWAGWLSSATHSPVGKPVMAATAVLAAGGLCYRVYQRRLDGFYVVAYLLLILFWPYPAEAKRLLFVIIPVLLVQGLLLLKKLPAVPLGRVVLRSEYGLLTAMILIALPDLALNIARLQQPLPEELVAYRKSAAWYEHDVREALESVVAESAIVESMGHMRAHVPEKECVYSIKPSLVGFLADRRSVTPPPGFLDEAEFRTALGNSSCRYFLLLGFASPSFPVPFYPGMRLGNSLKILATASDRMSNPLVILVEKIGEPRDAK